MPHATSITITTTRMKTNNTKNPKLVGKNEEKELNKFVELMTVS